jgi:predicted outer membrane repeat protein
LARAANGDTIDATGISGAILLTSGELLVDKSITINGPGAANLAVNGNASSRVFHVGSGTTVTIAGLTITNGNVSFDVGGGIFNDHATLTVTNCTVSGNSASYFGSGGTGGGIFNDGEFGSATLTVNNSTFSDNSASELGALGGGIFNDGEFGNATLTVNNSTFSGNSSASYGGGIFNDGYRGSAPLTLDNSTFSGNSATTSGGGIFNAGDSGGAPLTLINSSFSSNSAAYGGAIYNDAADLTLSNCTVSGNSASYFGGGIDNSAFDASAALTVTNSTISGNSASSGGGIFNDGHFGGSAALDLTGTILNAGASGENIYNDAGTVTSHGYNLSSDNGGGLLTAMGDQINTDPLLGPLQDNGGPTFTHELLSGSLAVDAGDPNFNPNSFNPPMVYDQRGTGFNRVVNGRIDIGAFEVQAVPSPYAGQVQQPINADGSSVFSVRRGVVPVKFTLTQGGVATCALPAATIALTRTAGGTTGQIDESVYSGSADTGSNFRISNCQYIYNLSANALGVGTYRVDIKINGTVVGSGIFQLK